MNITDCRSLSTCLTQLSQLIGAYADESRLSLVALISSSRLFFATVEWWCMGWAAGCSSLLLFSAFPSITFLISISLLLILARKSLLCCIFLPIACSLLWSTWWMLGHWQKQLPAAIEGGNIQISGRIENLPQYKTSHTQFRFRILTIEHPLIASDLVSNSMQGELVELSCYRCPWELLPEQEWQFTVRLKRPHGYASWGAFDYEKYLFRHVVIAKGYVRTKERNTYISQGRGIANQLRWKISTRLRETLDDYPLGKAVLGALLVGDKSGLSSDQKRVFQAVGVSHLLAISGLHIGLVFALVTLLCSYLLFPFARVFDWVPRQRLVLLPGLVAAFSYSALAGFSVSTQRAFIMLSIFVLSRLLGRETSLMRVLLIAAALILAIDPYSVLDAGYWLSCGAVFVIALSHYAWGSLSLFRLQPLLWLGMMPMTVAIFGKVSLVSPFINLLLVPLFCLALIPLALISLACFGVGLDGVSLVLTQYLASAFEYLYLALEATSNWSIAFIYPTYRHMVLGAMMVLIVLYLRRKRAFWVAVGVLALAVLSFESSNMQDGDHEIILLDVGQGLSMVVLVNDYVLVYDTGPAYMSGFNATEAVLIPFLRHRGIQEVDTLIISHADNDHIGGLKYLRSAFPIGEILTSRLDKVSGAQPCLSGQQWSRYGVSFEILGPDLGTPQGSNNLSCVLKVSNDKFRTLITGDIEKQVERYMLNSNIELNANILLVPHQGSKTSSTRPFVKAVNADLGLIAAGYRNHYGHPHVDVVNRYKENLTKLKSTIESGSILLKINNNSFTESSFRSTEKGVWHRQKKPKWRA